MSSSQWQRVEELFHAALELKPEDREEYLLRECLTDTALQQEVSSLVDAFEREKPFIQQPAMSLGLRVLSSQTKGSLVDQVIGHFKIVKLLGSGGMGEVYLAEDLTLERQVALKFLATGFGDDSWAKAQLKREAKAIAQLENPNICAIHRIEEVDGHNFIEMQYVEGETLQALIKSTTLDLDRALDFAEQISNALAAAHLRGVIHRDIKTQNIMVTPEGQIKVLDFGLAKLVGPSQFSPNQSQADQTSAEGLVIGTVAYMSPEQTRGEPLDPPTDVFSFGIVLSEMLSGVNPFLRENRDETISAIQNDEPQVDENLPTSVTKIIRGCLDKDRISRFENAEQVRVQLHELNKSRKPKEVPAWLEHKRLKYYAAFLLALLLVLVVASGFVYRKVSTVHTLALVQIKNESGDGNLNYLSQGLTRNLFEKFNYLPRFKVKQPTEVPSKPDKSIDVVRMGRDLKVESVLTGEVLKQDLAVVLKIRLFSTKDGSVMWEQTFKPNDTNLFNLQNEITSKVVSNLGIWLIGADERRLRKHQTNNEEALRNCMFGRQFWSRRDKANIKIAIDYFEKAIKLDPAYAEAYSGLSDCYVVMSSSAFGELTTAEAMGKARWGAQQALDLNDSLAEAHNSKAVVAFRYQWDWQLAETEFKRAIEIDPNYAPAYYNYSLFFSALGRHEEAIQQSDLGRQLDPYSLLPRVNYARTLYYARRPNDALQELNYLLEQNPDCKPCWHLKGLTLIQLDRYPEAIETLQKLYSVNPLWAAASLGYAYGKQGQRQQTLSLIRELDETSTKQPVPPLEWAIPHLGLGEKDETFRYLNLAADQRLFALPLVNAEPLYDDLRSDPRFKELTQKVGFPQH